MAKTKEERIVGQVQSIIDRACELGRLEEDTSANKVILDNLIYKLIRGDEIYSSNPFPKRSNLQTQEGSNMKKILHIFGNHFDDSHDPIYAHCSVCGRKGYKDVWDLGGLMGLYFIIHWETV